MEDVGREYFLGEEDPNTCVDDRTVSLSVFPCVCRQEQVEDGGTTDIVINKAWVTVVMRESHKAVENTGGDMRNEEAKRSMEFREGTPGGSSEDEEELGAEGEGGELFQTRTCWLQKELYLSDRFSGDRGQM